MPREKSRPFLDVALDLAAGTRRFAWGLGVVGLLITLLIEAAWWLGRMEQVIPHYVLDWVTLVWPSSWLLMYAEDASVPLALLILAMAVALNALLYAAVGAVVGAVIGLATCRP